MSTTARQLEETFRPILATGCADRGFSFRLRHEADLRTPQSVILSAEETGDVLGIKVSGRVGKACTIEVECRVGGGAAESPQVVEDLASALEDQLAAAATLAATWKAAVAGGNPTTVANALAALTAAGGVKLSTDWLYLRFLESRRAHSFDGPVRVLTWTCDMHALTAA